MSDQSLVSSITELPYDDALKVRQSVTRGEKLLQRIGQRSGVDASAQAAVIGMLDPFHDIQLTVTGFPDGYQQASVVQVITQQLSITKDPSLPTGPWDVSITMFPWLGPATAPSTPFVPSLACAGALTTQNTVTTGVVNRLDIPQVTDRSNFPYGVAIAQNVTAKANLDYFNTSGGSIVTQCVGLPSTYSDSDFRIIGAAFEVENVTPVLTRGGTATSWQAPFPGKGAASTWQIVQTGTSTNGVLASFSGLVGQAPPTYTGDAVLLAGSTSWKADDGCYNVQKFHINDLVDVTENYVLPLMYQTSPTDSTYSLPLYSISPSVQISNFSGSAIAFFNTLCWDSINMLDSDMTGTMFTGLDPTSILTLRVRWITQSFPGARDRLNVLTKPSPNYSAAAMELITEANTRRMAAGRYCDNYLGESFFNSVQSIADTALPVAAAFGVPGAGALNLGYNLSKAVVRSAKNNKAQSTYLPPSTQQALRSLESNVVKKALTNENRVINSKSARSLNPKQSTFSRIKM